jgi:non-ribosomal peptide synthetase component F
MGDLLTAHAANQPDKTAVIDDRTGGDVRTLTYAGLEARANQLVRVLVDLARRQDRVVWSELDRHRRDDERRAQDRRNGGAVELPAVR